MATKSSPTFQRGLTLIEACATLTIASILITAGWPSLKPTLDRKALQGLAAEMASDLQLARGEAVARQQGVRVAAQTVEGGSCAIVYTGPANACRCGDAAGAVCEAEGQAVTYRFLPASTGLSVTANVGSLRFDPRLGTATPAGTLRIASSSGEAVNHVVNLAGRVRSCTPNAAVPGFQAC
jgi:type IV fimbrial biogenesis protein FimT